MVYSPCLAVVDSSVDAYNRLRRRDDEWSGEVKVVKEWGVRKS